MASMAVLKHGRKQISIKWCTKHEFHDTHKLLTCRAGVAGLGIWRRGHDCWLVAAWAWMLRKQILTALRATADEEEGWSKETTLLPQKNPDAASQVSAFTFVCRVLAQGGRVRSSHGDNGGPEGACKA